MLGLNVGCKCEENISVKERRHWVYTIFRT